MAKKKVDEKKGEKRKIEESEEAGTISFEFEEQAVEEDLASESEVESEKGHEKVSLIILELTLASRNTPSSGPI